MIIKNVYDTLPTDAALVHSEKCKQAIELIVMAGAAPAINDPDMLEAVIRATEVATRAEILPPGKEVQLTNDFGVYCQITIDAFQKGYYGMLVHCQQNPELLERLRIVPEQEAEQEKEYLALTFLNRA